MIQVKRKNLDIFERLFLNSNNIINNKYRAGINYAKFIHQPDPATHPDPLACDWGAKQIKNLPNKLLALQTVFPITTTVSKSQHSLMVRQKMPRYLHHILHSIFSSPWSTRDYFVNSEDHLSCLC